MERLWRLSRPVHREFFNIGHCTLLSNCGKKKEKLGGIALVMDGVQLRWIGDGGRFAYVLGGARVAQLAEDYGFLGFALCFWERIDY